MSIRSGKSFLCLLGLLFISSSFTSVKVEAFFGLCSYQLTVTTLSGTTSNVSVVLADQEGNNLVIPNLARGNIFPLPQPPFQDGATDTFIGYSFTCLRTIPCQIGIVISGTGDRPSWSLGIVNVILDDIPSQTFYIDEPIDQSINYMTSRQLCHGPVEKSNPLGGVIGSSMPSKSDAIAPQETHNLPNTAFFLRKIFKRMMARSDAAGLIAI